MLNANMIENNLSQRERLEKLNNIAKNELEILTNDRNIIGVQKIDKQANNMIKTSS